MKIVYFGTPDFAVCPLEKIISEGYEVLAVVTNKDKPVGRKQILTPSPVKQCAIKHGIKVLQYDSVRKEGVSDLTSLNADLFVTCAFGQILSQEILDIPSLYTINIHGSILPLYRGAAPIQRAVIDGKKTTGITIMKTDAGIDTGDILLIKETEISEDETAGELFERLSVLGARAVIEALKIIESGEAVFSKQGKNYSYAKMIDKTEGKIDFSKSNIEIKNLVRGLNPSPSAYLTFNGDNIKIHKVELCDKQGLPGEVLSNEKDFIVACGQGSLVIKDLTKQGGKRMNGGDYLRGVKLPLGTILS